MRDKRFMLRNGVEIPVIGFGTGVVKRYIRKPSVFVKARVRPVLSGVKHLNFQAIYKVWQQDFGMDKVIDEAISQGYTLLDTGRIYGHSELEMGKAVNRSSLKRSDFLLIPKCRIWICSGRAVLMMLREISGYPSSICRLIMLMVICCTGLTATGWIFIVRWRIYMRQVWHVP